MTDDKITVKLDRQTAEDYLGNFYARSHYESRERLRAARSKVAEAVRKGLREADRG